MRVRLMRIMWVIAAVLGMSIAWVDSRPGWDDTGITGAVILVSSLPFGFGAPRAAWVFALIIGGFVPLIQIFLHRDAASLIALALSFIGVYIGVGFRQLFVR